MSEETEAASMRRLFEESPKRAMINGVSTDFRDKFLELEYSTLRKEIETVRDRYFRINAGALFIVPAAQIVAEVAGSGTNGSSIGSSFLALGILAPLPIIVLCLYMLYFSEYSATGRCATYIREHNEHFHIGKGTKRWKT